VNTGPLPGLVSSRSDRPPTTEHDSPAAARRAIWGFGDRAITDRAITAVGATIENRSHLVVHVCGTEGVALVLRPCYGGVMTRTISQRELRNDSGAIMRALDRGEVFLVTRNGIPVGELRPARRRFVSRDLLVEAFATAPRIDAGRFRDENDAVLDQTVEPRA
jgi:antitoxin (DNA-binding transcriptional repressor) of toxin-antitoxin stability system